MPPSQNELLPVSVSQSWNGDASRQFFVFFCFLPNLSMPRKADGPLNKYSFRHITPSIGPRI